MRLGITRASRASFLLMMVLPLATARGQSLHADGFAELGLVLPSAQTSFNRGGLGKTEFGGGHQTLLATGQALADLRAEFSDSLGAFATLRLAPDLHAPFDAIEAYARYRPPSAGGWVWTVKAGAFFPPISLENEAVGWTSPWTITSSAINSWVGDELRIIGGEASLEWRHASGSVGVVGALFAANDPAGALLADRGWMFDSRPIGLLGEPRFPDISAVLERRSPPLREEPFKELDGRPGWYAGATIRQDGLGRAALLYYDNLANPSLFSGSDFGWRTKFTSLGAELDIDDIVLLGQGMFGTTKIQPFDDFVSTTDFQSAYLLAGYSIDDYRVAGRVDVFATQQSTSLGASGPGEHGYALTAAGTWAPARWFHLTAEMLRVDSARGERAAAGLPTHAIEVKGQLVARLFF